MLSSETNLWYSLPCSALLSPCHHFDWREIWSKSNQSSWACDCWKATSCTYTVKGRLPKLGCLLVRSEHDCWNIVTFLFVTWPYFGKPANNRQGFLLAPLLDLLALSKVCKIQILVWDPEIPRISATCGKKQDWVSVLRRSEDKAWIWEPHKVHQRQPCLPGFTLGRFLLHILSCSVHIEQVLRNNTF